MFRAQYVIINLQHFPCFHDWSASNDCIFSPFSGYVPISSRVGSFKSCLSLISSGLSQRVLKSPSNVSNHHWVIFYRHVLVEGSFLHSPTWLKFRHLSFFDRFLLCPNIIWLDKYLFWEPTLAAIWWEWEVSNFLINSPLMRLIGLIKLLWGL